MPSALRILLLPISLATLVVAAPAWAAPVEAEHVTADVVAEPGAVVPGQPFTVATIFDLEPHWHLYWLNPGDSGLQPELEWTLPDGWSASEPLFPAPIVIETEGLVSYGHEGRMVLLTEITPSADTPAGSSVELKLNAEWLVCSDVCLPGEADLTLPLTVRETAEADPAHATIFRSARAKLPLVNDAWLPQAWREGDRIVLQFTAPANIEDVPTISKPWFFPNEYGLIPFAGGQELSADGTIYQLTLQADGDPASYPERLAGVLTSKHGFGPNGQPAALQLDIPIAVEPPAGAVTPPTGFGTAEPPGTGGGTFSGAPLGASGIRSLWLALLFAFAGGIILNLMPCVLPVLSLKVFGFMQQAGEDRREILAHGLVFTLGVLVSFWVLAGTLLGLRHAGEQIGWGFQLQSPEFLVVLCAFLFLFGLSLLGVFEIGLGMTTLGSGTHHVQGKAGSFLNGVTATVVATPCTAPFMGSALGFALSQSDAAVMAIFTLLGLGMASPYLLLSASPGLLKHLPRPGAWMETFKHVMGFLVIGTVVWLAWVFGTITGPTGMAYLLAAFFLIGIAAWVIGRFAQYNTQVGVNQRAWIGATVLLICSLAIGFRGIANGDAPALGATPAEAAEGTIPWEPFSPERVAELRAAGTPVFVDFTAKWCLTCLANEKSALNKPETVALFKEKGIVALKADWTKRDPVITAALAEYGRNSVPVYVLFGPAAETPVLLPEILTPSIVANALSELP